MILGVLAAAPVALLCNGAGLVLSYATLHERGGDVTKANPMGFGTIPTVLLALLFLRVGSGRVGSGGLARAEFWPLAGLFFGGELVVAATQFALLAGLGFSTAPGESHFVATLVAIPLVVLIAARENAKERRRGVVANEE